jgi:anthranilate synthase component 2
MIILIDNYDSFTYNLVQYLGDLGAQASVIRNDAMPAKEIIAQNPSGILISPGPSDPDHAGICLDLVKETANTDIPLLGVCLGHQTVGQAFGGTIIKTTPMHGKTSDITHNNTGPFAGLENPLTVTRYHSLIVEKDSLPDCLTITAQTKDGIIMGLSHREKPIHGVQFHPESIATNSGHAMLKNFLALTS